MIRKTALAENPGSVPRTCIRQAALPTEPWLLLKSGTVALTCNSALGR